MKLNFLKKKYFISLTADSFFKIFLIFSLAIIFIEVFLPGFVVSWFNPFWLLIIVFLSVIIKAVSIKC